MNWQSFKNQLVENPNLHLQFQYADGQMVKGGYHITEIKQAQITSVDCGGKMNAWTEIVVQVVETSGPETEAAMEVSKAMKIIHVVENQLALPGKAEVKIEFGNEQVPVQQMPLSSVEALENDLMVNMVPDATQCKAVGQGQSFGEPQKALVGTESGCCTPGGSCC